MSKKPHAKPTSKAETKTKPAKPTELSTRDLDQVAGGVSEIHFTKLVDKSSPQF